MNRKDELRTLAERVMRLDGPCREVDDAAAEFAGWKRVQFGPEQRDGWRNPWGNLSVEPPHFTADLNAAMTLVPEEWAIERLSFWPVPSDYADADETPHPARVLLLQCSAKRVGKKWFYGHGGTDAQAEASAHTPALALTAAALLARAEQVRA